jgi:hypothetical protein
MEYRCRSQQRCVAWFLRMATHHSPLPLHSSSHLMEASPPHSSFFSYDCGIYLFIGQIFPKKSFASKLPKTFKLLAWNPIITLAGVLVVYAILSFIILPFHLISYLITPYGSWLLFFLLILYVIRYFAICLIFPGSLPSLERKIANDYLRGMASQFEKIGNSGSAIASSLVHAATERHSNITLNLADLQTLSSRSLPLLIAVVNEGIRVLTVTEVTFVISPTHTTKFH